MAEGLQVKPHGVLFRPEMVLALLNTKPDVWPAEPADPAKPFKWQTRRGMKPQPLACEVNTACSYATIMRGCPHPVGQIVYAKETFCVFPQSTNGHAYRAGWDSRVLGAMESVKFKPGIHMPKATARLWFEVKRVRVERVNQISDEDAISEGIDRSKHDCGCEVCSRTSQLCPATASSLVMDYQTLFDSINGQGAFERGDWCWVYDLKRTSKPETSLLPGPGGAISKL